MNSKKLAAGILFVVLALRTEISARAQNVEQSAGANAEPAGLPEHIESVVTSTVPDNDPTAPAPEKQQSSELSIAKPHDDCFDGCCRSSCNGACPCVYGEVEALFMQQDARIFRQPLIVDPNTNTTFLSTSNLGLNFDPGVRATFGMHLCDGPAVEFTYFGIFPGNASAVVVAPNSAAFLIFPGNFAGNLFVGMDRAQLNFSSWINSFEVNFPCCCGCCEECPDDCGCGEINCESFTWFTGFRYLNFGEDFDIFAQRTVSGAVEQGAYRINTVNNLYGVQLGGRWRRMRGRFGWEATGRAGIFGNDARETQTVIDFPDFPLRPTVSNGGARVAFVGETNLSVLYQLTNVWNLKAGYNLMWIEGVALAPDQLDFNFAAAQGGTQLHNGGGLYLQGVSLGLEAHW